MAKTSLADFVTDWEALLKNVVSNAAELPNLDAYRGPLQQLLETAKDTIALSHARRGIKQEETRNLRAIITEGKDAAVKLRSAIKAHYGPRSERLIDYGMRPRRSKPRPATTPPSPPTVSPPPHAGPPPTNEKPKPETPASASHPETTPQAS
jgi:hypothetical protein